jgi:hypothetical protein
MNFAIKMLSKLWASALVVGIGLLVDPQPSEALPTQDATSDAIVIAADRGVDCFWHNHPCPGPRRECQHAVRSGNAHLRKEQLLRRPPMQSSSGDRVTFIETVKLSAKNAAIVGVPCRWIRRGSSFKIVFAMTMRMRN